MGLTCSPFASAPHLPLLPPKNKPQVSFRKRATNYGAFLWKMIYKDKAFYGSYLLSICLCSPSAFVTSKKNLCYLLKKIQDLSDETLDPSHIGVSVNTISAMIVDPN